MVARHGVCRVAAVRPGLAGAVDALPVAGERVVDAAVQDREAHELLGHPVDPAQQQPRAPAEVLHEVLRGLRRDQERRRVDQLRHLPRRAPAAHLVEQRPRVADRVAQRLAGGGRLVPQVGVGRAVVVGSGLAGGREHRSDGSRSRRGRGPLTQLREQPEHRVAHEAVGLDEPGGHGRHRLGGGPVDLAERLGATAPRLDRRARQRVEHAEQQARGLADVGLVGEVIRERACVLLLSLQHLLGERQRGVVDDHLGHGIPLRCIALGPGGVLPRRPARQTRPGDPGRDGPSVPRGKMCA